MRAERAIVLALIWTKWIPYVFRNTTSKLEPPCLSSHNTDRLLITAEGQSSCYSGAAIQDSLLTGMCGGTIKSTLQTLWESQKSHFCWNNTLCRSLLTHLTRANYSPTHTVFCSQLRLAALSRRHLERLQPLKYQTKYILVSLEATVHFLQQTGWSRLKTLFPLREGVHSVCAMIIFRGIRSRGMIRALGGWHSAGHLTGVCVFLLYVH